MRWQKKPWQNPMHWHRQFAWRPTLDTDSNTYFWLEHVWGRARTEGSCHDGPYYYNWEYRGGKDCPEIKEEPCK